MDKLKEFYSSFGFIIAFMFISILISAMFGDKFLKKFYLLILASQLLLNVDKAEELINKISFNNKTVNDKNTNQNNDTKTNIEDYDKQDSYIKVYDVKEHNLKDTKTFFYDIKDGKLLIKNPYA